MSSNDVGSYEFKRSPCEMQMEECSAPLARSTSDGSADNIKLCNGNNDNIDNNDDNNDSNNNGNDNDHNNNDTDNPPTQRWSSVLG